jgi:DedD protein
MDRALKQRLVGASVLIALAIIVLPMMLGGRPDGSSSDTREIEIPSQPSELSFESRRFPVGEERPQETPATEQETEVKTALPRPKSVPSAPQPEAAGNDTAQPASRADGKVEISPLRTPVSEGTDQAPDAGQSSTEMEPEKSGVITPAGSPGRYLVQVASFGSAENANRLAAQLREQGYAVLMDSIKSDIGVLNRVRVGPFPSESAAAGAAEKIKSAINGISPRVFDLQPQDAAPVTQPSDPYVRWIVQVGSFSNAANAENLVNKLRADGKPAYSEAVTSASSTVYRVRIGPFLDRELALETERQVRSGMGLNGVVMSAD